MINRTDFPRQINIVFLTILALCAAAFSQQELFREAYINNWKLKGQTSTGENYQLVGIENGRPVYYITLNKTAGEIIGADILRNDPNFGVDGNTVSLGIWDAGWVYENHAELIDRITLSDTGSAYNDHATHVAGTIGASGLDPNAVGMAPKINIRSYDWNDDVNEMLGAGATASLAPEKIYVSNHSYGLIAGWQEGIFKTIAGDFNQDDVVNMKDYAILAETLPSTFGSAGFNPICDIYPYPQGDDEVNNLDLQLFVQNWLRQGVEELYWFGVRGETEDRNFGRYTELAAKWDKLCSETPYMLPFKAAGNDCDDDAPAIDANYLYFEPNDHNWIEVNYNPVLDPNAPNDDGPDSNDWDTLPPIATAKNVITIGAVDDSCNITDFSGFGPTDDGRIKPDLVANGTDVFSLNADDPNGGYAFATGTSSASASAAGAAALVTELYERLFEDNMRASTLKALLIQTALDIPPSGPDYRTGWGLIQADMAAQLLLDDFNEPNSTFIIENSLSEGQTDNYTFLYDPNFAVVATLCWADPNAVPLGDSNDPNFTVLDNNTPMLVNDLDMRIVSVADPNFKFRPFTLDPNNPQAVASRFLDNDTDNVEQVSWPFLAPGEYTVQITHKGTLKGGSQPYSLVLRQPIPKGDIWVGQTISDPCAPIGSFNNPYPTIQEGIDAAAATDRVIVRDGTYSGDGNYDLDFEGKSITVQSHNGRDKCTIDCNDLGRAFTFDDGESSDAIVDGFTIINGTVIDIDASDANDFGGAISCTNASSPTIKNCNIYFCVAEEGGGGIYCGDNSNPLITNCDISGNPTTLFYFDVNKKGGAILCENASPTISKCDIVGNEAYGPGGGIACVNSRAVIIDCNIFDNVSSSISSDVLNEGGGIYLEEGNPSVIGCWIQDNLANNSGGGIAVIKGEDIELMEDVLDLDRYCCGSINIRDCLIIGNISGWTGGGIFSTGSEDLVSIKNCIIAKNLGLISGGVSTYLGSVSMIENCTITGNRGMSSFNTGGIRCVFGGSYVKNSILWGNKGDQLSGYFTIFEDVPEDISDPNHIRFASVSYSDIFLPDVNDPNYPTEWPGTDNLNNDPLFAKPAYWSDEEPFDIHLKSEFGRYNPIDPNNWILDTVTSPCIDAGDPASDFSSEPLPNGGRINMGAYGNTQQASKSSS